MIIMLDNYDSFTYNLVQYFQMLGVDVTVFRNDEVTPESVIDLNPELIVLSPGPGRPQDAGIMMELIAKTAGKIPLFGVCLGHQALGEYFGMTLTYAKTIMHGKTSEITHDKQGIYNHIPSPLRVVRYHSLALDKTTCPAELEITSETEDEEVMTIRHKTLPILGVQYHPESVLSGSGQRQLANVLAMARAFNQEKNNAH